jgi:hypothetical protein
MSLQLKIEYPDVIPDLLHETREQFEQEAKMAMACPLPTNRR